MAAGTMEADRLQLVDEVNLIGARPDPSLDALTELAVASCEKTLGFVSLIGETEQHFVSRVGTTATGTSRELALCAHTIEQPVGAGVFEVQDATLDDRFRDSELVTEDFHLRFYAGVPLRPVGDHAVGTLCVGSLEPSELTNEQRSGLVRLAGIAEHLLRLRLLDGGASNVTEAVDDGDVDGRMPESSIDVVVVENRWLEQQLAQANSELTEAAALRSQAVRAVAHDLASPLAAMRITAEAVSAQLEPSALRKHVDKLVDYARQAEGLIGDLRMVNDPGSSGPEFYLQAQPLAPIVENAAMWFSDRIDAGRLVLDLDDVHCACDARVLGRVVHHLVMNAFAHNPPDTNVVVSTRLLEDFAVIEVIDDGVGIAAEERERMLQPYSTLDPERSGLGLAISDALIAGHHGTLSLGTNLPAGTVVTVKLPL